MTEDVCTLLPATAYHLRIHIMLHLKYISTAEKAYYVERRLRQSCRAACPLARASLN